MLVHASKKRRLLFVSDARRIEIRIEIRCRVVMRWHLVTFATFSMQSNPSSFPVLVIVFDAHVDHGRDSREGVAHEADERAITESDY